MLPWVLLVQGLSPFPAQGDYTSADWLSEHHSTIQVVTAT